MGRKRKVEKVSSIDKEGNTSNASPQTAGEEILHPSTDWNAIAKQVTSVGNSVHQDSNLLSTKEKTSTPLNLVPRRSVRGKTIEEHVNLVQSERKEAAEGHQVSPLPAGTERIFEQDAPQTQELSTIITANKRNLEQKVDHLVQAVGELKSKVTERQNEDQCADFSYKSLYIESQKKIEELMENNFELVRKLDFALGKIEAYEKMMVGSKEVILVSDQGKGTVQKPIGAWKNNRNAADVS